ncbi:hypothetical protein FHG87_013007 [Trinorchestia longiramus]|nr:hypothetical protein FHG87_013007 [Trinorchestia longiramus]
MNQPPEVLDAGEEFEIISEVQPLCATDELPRVPAFERPSLVDSVPLFGLLLVAKGGTLVVKKSRTVLSGSPGGEGSEVWCGGRITHITHACDGLTIFVITIWGDDCPHLLCFDTAGLVQQGSSASPYLECSNSSSAGSRVLGLAVNPTDPACVAYCTSTGDLTVLNISTNSVTYNTKKNMGARAIGWSAKGKQMCVGCQDGSLSLHKPDLAPVRIIAAPPLFAGAAAPVTALVWFTNTEFFVAYQQSNNQPCLVYVNGPKGQPAQYINYEDVCYSNDSPEPLFYHLLFIPQWNQLLVLSSGGIEMATLIKTSSGAWAQLALEEGSRAEMHFINVTQETFPLGITLDLCSTKTFTVKEDVTEGPHPVVVSLSTGGELNIFHLVNRLPDKPDLRASLPAQPAPAGPVRTAQQYCSNIVIPPRPHASSALSSAVDAGLPGTSSSAGVASSGFAFSSNFTNPSSVAGFTATSSTAIASAPATNYSSSFASTNTFAAPGTTSSNSASFLSGIGTIVSASTTNASSTLFQTSNTTSASGSLGLFSRPSVPPSNGSSLFGGASMFSQNKAPTSSLFGGGVSLGGSVYDSSRRVNI